MKMKKLLSLTLVATMCASIFAGCGKADTKNSENVTNTNAIEVVENVEDNTDWSTMYDNYFVEHPIASDNFGLSGTMSTDEYEATIKFEIAGGSSRIFMELGSADNLSNFDMFVMNDGKSYMNLNVLGESQWICTTEDMGEDSSVISTEELGVDEKYTEDISYYCEEEIDGVMYDILEVKVEEQAEDTEDAVSENEVETEEITYHYYINRETQELSKIVASTTEGDFEMFIYSLDEIVLPDEAANAEEVDGMTFAFSMFAVFLANMDNSMFEDTDTEFSVDFEDVETETITAE